jgi:hypothetical protein
MTTVNTRHHNRWMVGHMEGDPFDNNLFLATILQELLELGFAPPIHCAIVGVNGSVSAMLIQKVDGGVGFSSTRTVENIVDGRFVVPINVFFVDSRGEAVRTESR